MQVPAHTLLLQSQQEGGRKANKYLGASGTASPALSNNLGHGAPVGNEPLDVPAGWHLQASELGEEKHPPGKLEMMLPGAGEALGTVRSHPGQLLCKCGLLSCFSCIQMKQGTGIGLQI